MKYLLLNLCLMITGCDLDPSPGTQRYSASKDPVGYIRIVEYKNHEYLEWYVYKVDSSVGSLTHYPDCRFCSKNMLP